MVVCRSDVVDDSPGVVSAFGEFGVDLDAGRVDGAHVAFDKRCGVFGEGIEDVAADDKEDFACCGVCGESGGNQVSRFLSDLPREGQTKGLGAGDGQGSIRDPFRLAAFNVGDVPFVDAGQVVWREPVVPFTRQVEALRRVRVACEVVDASVGVVDALKAFAAGLRGGGECALLRLKLVDGVDDVAAHLEECMADLRLVLNSIQALQEPFDEVAGDGSVCVHAQCPCCGVGGV